MVLHAFTHVQAQWLDRCFASGYVCAKMKTKFLVVWGMGRSGTSVLARALQVFGADLGENLFRADRGNPKGYFEDLDLMRLNRSMLAELGLAWDSLAAVSEEQAQDLADKGYLELAAAFLKDREKAGGMVGLKEPRMTILLPFWRMAFARAEITPCSFIAFRHPLSVAASLQKRAATWQIPSLVSDLRYGCLLWLVCTQAALLHTVGWPRALVSYENLLADAPRTLLAAGAGMGLDVDTRKLAVFAGEFLDNSLNNNAGEGSRRTDALPAPARALHDVLCRAAPSLKCPQPEELPPAWPQNRDEALLASLLDYASGRMREMAKFDLHRSA